MKFPVIRAYSATFAYLAGNAGDLVRLLWLPALILVAAQMAATAPMFAAIADIVELGPNPEPAAAMTAVSALAKWAALLFAASMIAYPMLTVASLTHLVRGEMPKGAVYLRYGADELRVLGGYLLLSLMVMVISLVGGLAASLVMTLAVLALPAARGFLGALGDALINIAVLVFRLRLSTLYPAALATETIGLDAAWRSTRGSALPLAAFWTLVWFSIAPVALVLMAPILMRLYPLVAPFGEAHDDTAMRAALAPLMNEVAAIFTPGRPEFFMLAGLLFIATMATNAVFRVASGVAWRYLSDAPRNPRADDAAAMAA